MEYFFLVIEYADLILKYNLGITNKGNVHVTGQVAYMVVFLIQIPETPFHVFGA